MNSLRPLMSSILCAVVFLSIPAAAGEQAEMPAMSPEALAEMNAWMKLAEPGDHHQHLAAFEGSWKGEIKNWMSADSEPMLTQGRAEARLILGGRFLEWTHTGDFFGSPFEGRAIEGYNNGDERYESVWLDNFGTLMLFNTGSGSSDGKKREMASEFSNPVTGGTIKFRTVYEWIDADHFTYTAFMDDGKGEFKNMVINWKRE